MFVAIRGVISDGHDYIEKAIDSGAVAIVCEEIPEIKNDVIFVKVEITSEALAYISGDFYDNPSGKLKLVGVTGTNGKTTTTTLLFNLFRNMGLKVGLISTVNIRINEQEFKTNHTTPNSITLNYYMNQMISEGVEYCFMEVSSHGISQNRTKGLSFVGGVFTNLTHDHLDYHKDFKSYRDVKKSFFDNLPKTAFAISNRDDSNGSFMLQNTKAYKKYYSLQTIADYNAKLIESDLNGSCVVIDRVETYIKLIGRFNVYNSLAIYSVAIELGLDKTETLQGLSSLETVGGRFEHFVSETGIHIVVDYAHTPDALKNVLETLTQVNRNSARIYTVVGCGGDRDKTKRPIMGRIAVSNSDMTIFTSDNPRTENPNSILEEMESDLSIDMQSKFLTIENRNQAIKTACKLAEPKDIILIAGKGHEKYQDINGVKQDFDDVLRVKTNLKQLSK